MQKDGARVRGRSASNPSIMILGYEKATSLADWDMWMSGGSASDPSVEGRKEEGRPRYLLPL
jgi:hypothetical protein